MMQIYLSLLFIGLSMIRGKGHDDAFEMYRKDGEISHYKVE